MCRLWLGIVTSCGLLSAGICPALSSADHPRLNVLFLALDDMNDWAGCLGGFAGKVHRPHIDRLAGRGMLFENAHCPAPVCNPSRTAVLTGLPPTTTGIYDNGRWWRPALTTHGRGNHSLPTEQFRYIRYADGSEELSDHRIDPHEWENVAGTADFARTKEQLKKWLPREEAKPAPGKAAYEFNPARYEWTRRGD